MSLFNRYEFAEWQQYDITTELMKQIAETATGAAQEILIRETVNTDRDQYLKGFIAGLSLVAGWKPEIIKEEGESITDVLKED